MMSEYYNLVRSEISPLLPPNATRILDVGCGVGATSAWLKTKYPGSQTIGLEGNAVLLPELARNVDEAHIIDLNGPLPEVRGADLVLLLDVLEHLVHPEALLTQIVSVMADDATVVISLPNVAHLSVSLPLLFFGRFTYADAGILDRTHLRFFYIESALGLARGAGLEVEKGLLNGFGGAKTRWVDRLTFGMIKNRLAKQYIFSARRDRFIERPAVKWQRAE